MGSTLCNVFAAIALLILFAHGVHAVFMFIATLDDMSNDYIFNGNANTISSNGISDDNRYIYEI